MGYHALMWERFWPKIAAQLVAQRPSDSCGTSSTRVREGAGEPVIDPNFPLSLKYRISALFVGRKEKMVTEARVVVLSVSTHWLA
jgi:hypothetical protein